MMTTTTKRSVLLSTKLAIFLALAAFNSSCSAWSVSNSAPKLSRRNFLDVTVAGSAAAAAFGTVAVAVPASPAYADVTNKVASSTALRKLKRAQKQLDGLLPDVEKNDYTAVKGFFREPPFDEVRKNARTLVLGGEDGPKAAELEGAYKNFVASMEKIDSTASLAIRGRKIEPFRLKEEYDLMKTSMQDFVTIAEAAAEIPVQYSDKPSE